MRCTEGFLFAIREGKLMHDGTRYDVEPTVVAEIADSLGLPVDYERAVCSGASELQDLYSAEEVFLAGTTCGIIGVVRVCDSSIGTGTEGPITRRIREAYRRLTHGE
jgi:branched-subunit amino acid aminotransferase/4-amino-4-deoxychorismate lyase